MKGILRFLSLPRYECFIKNAESWQEHLDTLLPLLCFVGQSPFEPQKIRVTMRELDNNTSPSSTAGTAAVAFVLFMHLTSWQHPQLASCYIFLTAYEDPYDQQLTSYLAHSAF